jgi:hypothetical protein
VVVSSIGHRVGQVVVGAAGYDGRAFRYARPGVRWFEVDHPATQADKLARIARLGLNTSRVTLFLLEGVAVYLEQPVLERVLGEFRAVTVAGSPLAISVSAGSARSAGRERLRSAGLLLARAAASPGHPERPRPTRQPPASSAAVTPPSPVAGRLPLSALLSHALVAFTIEADNEAEHRLPHTTRDYGRPAGAGAVAPWMTSLVMWANCLRHVPEDGITLAAMREAARTSPRRSKTAGGLVSATHGSTRCATPLSHWPSATRHPCSAASRRTQTAGAPGSRPRRSCRTTR